MQTLRHGRCARRSLNSPDSSAQGRGLELCIPKRLECLSAPVLETIGEEKERERETQAALEIRR